MTDPARHTVPTPTGQSDAGLFANTPVPRKADRRTANSTPNPDAGTVLFAEDRPARRTPTAPRKSYPRWRDEDMPLRPGDIITVGLANGRAPVGQVAAVNDHCFRLNGYTFRTDRFTCGVIVIGWSQVDEFGPVARRRGDQGHEIEPLLTFSEDWQNRRR